MNIKEWNKSSEKQRNGICSFQLLTPKLIGLIWKRCTEYQRSNICVQQHLTQELINSIWEQCTERQRDCICEFQPLTHEFIKYIWKDCTNDQRCYICANQNLIPKTISFIWNQSTEDRENICDCFCECQNLTPRFIKHIWKQCNKDQRFAICEYQKLIPKFSRFSKEQQKLLTAIHKYYPNKEQRIQRAKEYAAKYNLKIKGNYLHVFRNHTKGKGMFSKINIYKTGIMYQDWHCDPRPEVENSYGFGVWPTGNTPIVVPLDKFVVEVNRDDGKARVEAFKVIK